MNAAMNACPAAAEKKSYYSVDAYGTVQYWLIRALPVLVPYKPVQTNILFGNSKTI